MFDDFTVENGATSIGLTKELAIKWAEKRPNESDVTRYKRVNTIIIFSIYLNQLGYESYIPRQLKSYKTTFTPFIFSKEELESFFHASETIEIKGNTTIRHILPVVFRMIYGCGLRVRDALNLKCKSLNLDEGYITIREKNGCDRVLLLSDSLKTVCIQYSENCLSKQNPSDYFFPYLFPEVKLP